MRALLRWRERLAFHPPPVPPGAVWVHAASLGEGRAADALLRAIRATRPALVTLRTATSPAVLGPGGPPGRAHLVAPLPYDLPGVVDRWLDAVRPGVLVLVEGELWPVLLAACARRGIAVVAVGARPGHGAARFARLAPRLWSRTTSAITQWWVTDDAVAALRTLVPGARLAVTADLKREPAEPVDLGLERPVIVAGSTRPGDEQAVLAAWRRLGPRPRLVLAPRHPERFDALRTWLDTLPEAHARRSAGPTPAATEVLLLDTLGELAGAYAHADAAFVGGTFDAELGGHSPAEAAAWGLPVIRGPCHHANDWGGVRSVEAPTPAHLGDAFAAALVLGRTEPPPRPDLQPVVDSVLERRRTPGPRGVARPWARPLVPLWRLATALDRAVARPRTAPLPVVSVGALTAGGAGKTPAVREVARLLASLGHRPVLIARGHGRGPGPALRVAGDVGDELAMLAGEGLMVVSCPDRAAAVARGKADGATVAVLDDGFQHHRLNRDLDIVVYDPEDTDPAQGALLPAGNAREPLQALGRAHLLWLTGPGDQPAFHGPVVRSRVEVVGWTREGRPCPPAVGPVRLVCGVARPARVVRTLVADGVDLRDAVAFPDHHRFRRDALEALLSRGLPLVTTAKDAPRWPAAIPVTVVHTRAVLEDPAPVLASLRERVGLP